MPEKIYYSSLSNLKNLIIYGPKTSKKSKCAQIIPQFTFLLKLFIFEKYFYRVRVKISNSQILEWLTFRIWKLTNVQILNSRTYESLQ